MFGSIDLTHSLGLTTLPEGKISDVLWDGPAFEAGLTIGTTIHAVEGREFSPEILRDAVAASREGVRLDVTKAKVARTVTVACTKGLRYPHLEAASDAPGRLDQILRAL